jgi:hypothetical protein
LFRNCRHLTGSAGFIPYRPAAVHSAGHRIGIAAIVSARILRGAFGPTPRILGVGQRPHHAIA